MIKIPSTQTFTGQKDPDWSNGKTIDKVTFNAMIHLELGIYLLRKGKNAKYSFIFESIF